MTTHMMDEAMLTDAEGQALYDWLLTARGWPSLYAGELMPGLYALWALEGGAETQLEELLTLLRPLLTQEGVPIARGLMHAARNTVLSHGGELTLLRPLLTQEGVPIARGLMHEARDAMPSHGGEARLLARLQEAQGYLPGTFAGAIMTGLRADERRANGAEDLPRLGLMLALGYALTTLDPPPPDDERLRHAVVIARAFLQACQESKDAT